MQVSGFTRAPILWFHASSKPLVSLSLWQSQSSTTVMYSFPQAPILWLKFSCFAWAPILLFDQPPQLKSCYLIFLHCSNPVIWSSSTAPIQLFDLLPLIQSCYLIFLHCSNPVIWSSSTAPILLFDLPPLLLSCYLIFLHCTNPVQDKKWWLFSFDPSDVTEIKATETEPPHLWIEERGFDQLRCNKKQ
jgi:hypothetical protein